MNTRPIIVVLGSVLAVIIGLELAAIVAFVIVHQGGN